MNTIEQTAPNIFSPVEKMAQQLQSFTRQQKARLVQLVPELRTIQPFDELRAPPEEAVISPQQQQAQALANCMAQRLAPIPSMEKVYVQPREWGFECWIVAQGSTLAERFQLYDEQWVLMEEEPNTSFKFHLVERYDSQLSDLLTTQQMASGVISRENQHA